jgi:hypothetical protein
MTSPLHAREIKGKGRYYGSCGDGCPFGDDLLISVTNAQSVVAKPALVPAAVKVTAETAWQYLPAMVALSRQTPNGPNGCDRKRVAERCGSCRFCLTAAIKAEHRNQWDTAADFGSLVHTYAYSHVVGKPMPADADVQPFLGQYLRFLEAWRVDLDKHVEAAETTIIDRRNGYAGTGDIWLQLPTGPDGRRQLWLVDIKTSLKAPVNRVYPDQELQLAGLRFAPKALLPDDTEIDVPKFAGAALLNLRADAHQLIPLPADKAAHRAFLGAVTLQRHFHSQDTKGWTPLEAPALPEPNPRKVA